MLSPHNEIVSLLEPELVPPLAAALKYSEVQQSSQKPSGSHWFSWDAEDTLLLTTLALNVHVAAVLRVAFVGPRQRTWLGTPYYSFHQRLLGKLLNSTGVRAWLDNI